MTVDDLTNGTGAWLAGDGPMSDVIISSRIRLARNLEGYPFLSTSSETQRTEICRTVGEAAGSVTPWTDALYVDLDAVDAVDRQVLSERHIISHQHAGATGSRAVCVSIDEKQSLMINEEDHLRVQVMTSGLQLESLWEDISAVDDELGRDLAFAFDEQLGFLTACPTNVGTGLRVSVMLHLPALKLTKEIERVFRAARDMRLAVRGLHGEGTDAVGDLLQISNQTTLGKSEEAIVADIASQIVPKIVEYERAARTSLLQHRPDQLDDKVWRAYGILQNARCISTEELHVLLSPIRMGIHLDRFHQMDVATVNELFLYGQSGHLQKRHGGELSGEERGIERANYIRRRLGEK